MLFVLPLATFGFIVAPQMSSTAAKRCDYLVVGAGASGMAFVDSLLLHSSEPVSVVLLDKRQQPGGHWNDAYDFVTIHQPARNYGVESSRLEDAVDHPEKLASKADVCAYYSNLLETWAAKGHTVDFVGGAAFDFTSGTYSTEPGAPPVSVTATRKIVDARFTENDLPVHVPPKFAVDTSSIDLIPPNVLPSRRADATAADGERHYCVLGAGKTGQDTMLYLREKLQVPAERIVWVMPTAPWITARDPPAGVKQNTCMEFIASVLEAHATAGAPAGAAEGPDFLQRGFEKLETEGKVYRIHPSAPPTKFMDATLNRREVQVLRDCASSIVTGRGRVASISADGVLNFADGSSYTLPWTGAGIDASASTTFVHCTAGAFNFGSSASETRPPIFQERMISIQEIFQFPGFCFNGAVIAWLECQNSLSLSEKNALCELPPQGDATSLPLGPVAGDVGALSAGHPLAVSLRNLRRWYATPGMGAWLHTLRLFSLTMNGYTLAEGTALAERNHEGLVAAGVEPK